MGLWIWGLGACQCRWERGDRGITTSWGSEKRKGLGSVHGIGSSTFGEISCRFANCPFPLLEESVDD